MLQRGNALDAYVKNFVKGEVKNEEDALKGARDIIAEQVNEDEQACNQIRISSAAGSHFRESGQRQGNR